VVPPLARKPTTEESVFGRIARVWAYFTYAIRRFMIFLRCFVGWVSTPEMEGGEDQETEGAMQWRQVNKDENYTTSE
jgi:hypothetical protein